MIEDFSKHEFFKILVGHFEDSKSNLRDEVSELFLVDGSIVVFSDAPDNLHHFDEVLISRAAEMDVSVVSEEFTFCHVTFSSFSKTLNKFLNDVFS